MAIHTMLRPFVFPFTAFIAPVWRVGAEADHKLPAETITGIEINGTAYARVNSHAALRETERSFMLDSISPIRILVHFDNSDPPFAFEDVKFRVEWQADPIINNLVTEEGGGIFIASDAGANIITFRERA